MRRRPPRDREPTRQPSSPPRASRTGIKPGVIFMPFHFADAPANALTSGKHLDPQAKIPGLKATAVSVRRAGGAPSAT